MAPSGSKSSTASPCRGSWQRSMSSKAFSSNGPRSQRIVQEVQPFDPVNFTFTKAAVLLTHQPVTMEIMTTYTRIEDAWEDVELPGMEGEIIGKPRIQCELCGEGISAVWARRTGQCGACTKGFNQVGDDLERIYTVGVYCPETDDHELTNELRPPKDGTYAEKKARMLQWGIENFDELDRADLLVPPPSGTDPEDNHMADTGELLSEYVDIPFGDIAKGEYEPQTDMETGVERMENVEGEIDVEEDLSNIGTVIVIDDIVTTCSTLSDTARALLEAGVGQVIGLGATRSMNFEGLVRAELMEEK